MTKNFAFAVAIAAISCSASAEVITCTRDTLFKNPACARLQRVLVGVNFRAITFDTAESATPFVSRRWTSCPPMLLADDKAHATTAALDQCGADALPILARGGYVTVPTPPARLRPIER